MHETVKQTIEMQYKEAIHDKNTSIEKLKAELNQERSQIMKMKETNKFRRALMKDMQQDYQKNLDNIQIIMKKKWKNSLLNK